MIRVSVVTRSKNESNELEILAKILKKQSIAPIELILVDNNSEDKSVEVARKYGFKVFGTDTYFPGNALNIGIAESTGDFVIIVSSHCIPTNCDWIKNLIQPLLLDQSIAGVYGRQLPTKDSKPNDRRDLYTIFGTESKLQNSEIFFHNANSVIRKSVWTKIPFSNSATNIEDRIWAKEVLANGYRIFYNAEAPVFHSHGVNHNGDESRALRLVNVFREHNLYEHEQSEDWYK